MTKNDPDAPGDAKLVDEASPSRKLRLAFIVDTAVLDYRSAQLITLADADAHVEIVWIGLAADRCEEVDAIPPWHLRVALSLDEKIRLRTAHPGLRTVRHEQLAAGVARLDPLMWRSVLSGTGAGCEESAKDTMRPDLLISLSRTISTEDLAQQARIPVWSFMTDGGPAGSALEGYRLTGAEPFVATIWLVSDWDREPRLAVLAAAECRRHASSQALTRARLQLASIRMFCDLLGELETSSLSDVINRRASRAHDHRGARPKEPFRWNATLGLLGQGFSTAIRARLRGHAHAVQWSVGIASAKNSDWRQGRVDEIDWLNVGTDRFLADPCLVDHEGKTWLFMEEFHYSEGRGVISVIDAADAQSWRRSERVLTAPFHLSFPYVFELDGDFFMLPEQAESGQIVLYRSSSFPSGWRPHAVLLPNMPAADPVLVRHDGYWWLFFSRADYGSCDNNLQVYFSPHLEGPYQRHRMTPVRQSLLGSRMAGAIFVEDGRLIRPAQDCRRSYGAAMVFHEITELSPETYKERAVSRIEAKESWPFGKGTHTFSKGSSLVAIDGFRFPGRASLSGKGDSTGQRRMPK